MTSARHADAERSPIRPLAWTVLSLATFVGGLFATLPANAVLASLGVDHMGQMVGWSVVWGGLGCAGVLLAGRLAFGEWLRFSAAAVAIAVVGIGLSGGVHVALQEWAVIRFGYYDPEFVWWTAGLFAALIGVGVAAFGVFVAPPGAAWWPIPFLLMGATAVVLIVLGNVPGLQDGIEPESWPLAAWIGASGGYAVVATALSLVRTLRPPGSPVSAGG